MIDLHAHSTASDGTLSPAELAEAGRGFSVLALTDHDTLAGVREFMDASHRLSPAATRLAGVEISVVPGDGYGRFHMLGLGVDADSPALCNLLGRIRVGRDERNEKIFERLAALGMPVSHEEVEVHARGEVLARPHFARVLVDRGLAVDVKDAFEKFLGTGKPAYAERYRPDPGEAIDAIHAAHGVAVMAHPKFWTQDADALSRGLAVWRDRGLDGVEAVYKANTFEEIMLHLRVAHELGLAATAGSDFHGGNKPTVSLGMDVGDENSFLAPFFDALEKRAM